MCAVWNFYTCFSSQLKEYIHIYKIPEIVSNSVLRFSYVILEDGTFRDHCNMISPTNIIKNIRMTEKLIAKIDSRNTTCFFKSKLVRFLFRHLVVGFVFLLHTSIWLYPQSLFQSLAISLLCLFIFGASSALSPNIAILLVTRCITGFVFGGATQG